MARSNREEVWLVDLGYAAKVRPCLVLSIEALDTDRALVSLIPRTTSPRGTRFEINVPTTFPRQGVFDAQDPIAVADAKLIKGLGILSADQLAEVEDAVRLWLGL